MAAQVVGSGYSSVDIGVPRLVRVGKQILNAFAERAGAAADRSRFAALPTRYLDDVGMTEAERAAALGYAESIADGWRVVATHL